MKGKIPVLLACGLLVAPILADAQGTHTAPTKVDTSSAPVQDADAHFGGQAFTPKETRQPLGRTNSLMAAIEASEIDPSSAARSIAFLLGCLLVTRVRRRKINRLMSAVAAQNPSGVVPSGMPVKSSRFSRPGRGWGRSGYAAGSYRVAN